MPERQGFYGDCRLQRIPPEGWPSRRFQAEPVLFFKIAPGSSNTPAVDAVLLVERQNKVSSPRVHEEPVAIDHHDVNQQLFLQFLDRYGASLRGLLFRLCGNAHDVDDLFQETAVKVWRNLHSRPKLRNPRAWLMTIAYRCFLDHRRRLAWGSRWLGDVQDDQQPDPHQQTEQADEIRKINELVAQLPEQIRVVFALHYTGGLSLRETARAMDVSVGTIKSRLNAGLQQIRREIS